MTFYDLRLPENIERGAVGGPGFKTTVLSLSSGFERRNINWARSRGNWNISYGITNKSELDAVINQFYAMSGMAGGFRFKDWSDFQIGDTLGGDTSTAQQIGVGDGINPLYQIFKRYDVSITFFDRPLSKIVSGTARVFVDGVEQTNMENVFYVVDYTQGTITFQPGHLPGTQATNVLTLDAITSLNAETVTLAATVYKFVTALSGGTAATNVLTLALITSLNGETVVLGATTYKFVTALTGAADEVLIGATAATAATNLISAITGGAGIGTTYGTGTVANASATAATGGSGKVNFTALAVGTAGNSIACHGTLTDAGNVFSNTDGTLNGGVAPVGLADEVLIGATAATAATNLISAIMGTAGAGTTYGLGTVANASVTAATGGSGVVDFTSVVGGTPGNTVACHGTLSDAGNVFSDTDGTLNGGTSPVVSVMCEFDVPVRFATDDLQINTQVFTSEAVIEIPQITLIETRETT